MTHERFCLSCGYDNLIMSHHGNGPRGMKWYKFLVWFSLFAAAISAVYSFCYYFSTYWECILRYDLDDIFPNVDNYGIRLTVLPFLMVLTIGFLCFGVFALFTRHKLVKYQKDAPRCVVGLYVGSALLSLGQIVINSMTQTSVVSGVVGIITALIMAALNYSYFDNRSDLFVN